MGFTAPQHRIGEPGLLSEVLRVSKRSAWSSYSKQPAFALLQEIAH
jgi:hypothetical protein